MEKLTFPYKKMIKMGFVREDYKDQVVFDETGNHPVNLTKYLSKGISLSWEDGELTLFRKLSQSEYKSIKVETMEQLEKYIDFFTPKPTKSRESHY